MSRKLSSARRHSILEAARRLFGSRGYAATSVADIARELRMGHGTFYRYFANKRELFEAVIDELLAGLASISLKESPSAPKNAIEYRGQVERMARSIHGVFRADEQTARLLFVEALGLDDAMTAKVETAFDVAGQFTAMYLRHGVAQGYLRPELDIERTAFALNAVTYEGLRRTARAPVTEAEMEAWIGVVTTLMFGGIVLPAKTAKN
jgi:AcrR family transcriptional regulator